MGTMYDSVNSGAIPVDAVIVAGYYDGHYRWTDHDWSKFPYAKKVSVITQYGTNVDVGARPVLYTSLSNVPALKYALTTAGIYEFDLWIAHYDGQAVLIPGSVAKQYANPTLTHHNYDVSITRDDWPGNAPFTYAIDIETGDFTNASAVSWLMAHKHVEPIPIPVDPTPFPFSTPRKSTTMVLNPDTPTNPNGTEQYWDVIGKQIIGFNGAPIQGGRVGFGITVVDVPSVDTLTGLAIKGDVLIAACNRDGGTFTYRWK